MGMWGLGMGGRLGLVTAGHLGRWALDMEDSLGCATNLAQGRWLLGMEGCLGWVDACQQADKGQVSAWDGPLA